jgi:hypothetical protein
LCLYSVFEKKNRKCSRIHFFLTILYFLHYFVYFTFRSPLSLASLSLEAGDVMQGNPYYNIFRHAFLVLGNANEGEAVGMFDGSPIEEYGNTIVEDLFDLSVENIEAEAALVMNVWMVLNHELFTVLEACGGGDGPADTDKALSRLDRAVALWIGEEQDDGANNKGHMMYNLAEQAGARFGQDQGETAVNTEIMALFVGLQASLQQGKCDESNAAGYIAIRAQVKRAIGLMTVPLVQMLIHHTQNVGNEGGSNFVELYALALIPRVAACDPDAYDNELRLDVLRELTPDKSQESIRALQASLSCLQITCADVGEYEGGVVPQCTDPVTTSMAGYTTTRTDALAKSFLDRDILQIDIFLKFRALDSAMDWYKYGWNSVYSLQEVARNQIIPAVEGEQYDIYQSYYQSDTFAHNWLIDIMEEVKPPFNNASFDQTRELATSILKYVVMYLASISSFQYAVAECEANNKLSALNFWDTGVAFYIGSMEGSTRGGSKMFGQLLFSTAKELCGAFQTCISAGEDGSIQNAISNEVVMTGFIDGVQAITADTCQFAKNILNAQIIPNLDVPLFQGTVQYASFNAGLGIGTTDASLAIGYAFSRGILPLVGNDASALTIQSEMAFDLNTKPVPGGFAAVANALRAALPDMDTACFDIGTLTDEPTGDLCKEVTAPTSPAPQAQVTPAPVGQPTLPPQQPTVPAPSAAPIRVPVAHPVDNTPANLAFGRYIFSDSSIADGDGNFALDVRDMFNAESTVDAINVYNDGVNALTTGLSGELGTVSLASLSTEAAAYMAHDPMFNIFKYALFSDDDFEDTAGEDFTFADDVVQEAISNAGDNKLAAEAAVVLNVWMVITHKLYTAVNICSEGGAADTLIDSAVALWIGKEQADGKFDNGWMMYSVGQSAANFFGMEEGEAPINTQLMTQFTEAQSLAKTCGGSSNYLDLRVKVFEIIRSLTKPLILSLLFHMVHNNKNMVELYAVSVVPQCVGCSDRAHEALQDALYEGYDYTADLTDDLIGHLATFLRCMRITCDDLRVQGDASQSLKDLVSRICERLSYPGQPPIVGYIPTSDVTEYARFDVDILLVEIFMDTQAYKAAQDYYENGSNVWATNLGTEFISLKSLATDDGRDIAPQYKLFREYYDNLDYADEFIMAGLKGQGDYNSASRGQRSEIVTSALTDMVVYMAVLQKMYSAVRKCVGNDLTGAAADWDKSVALLVGSMEGTIAGGIAGGEGYMIYGEANYQCLLFDTCEPSGEAKSNEELMSVISSLKDSLANSQCDNVKRKLGDDIVPSMTIPLVQGVLGFAKSNQGSSPSGDYDETGAANIMASSVAPLVDDVNETSALLLETSFLFGPVQVPQGTASIYAAFSYALRGMGINCEDIGLPVADLSLTVCEDPTATGGSGGSNPTPIAPHPDTPTVLGDNVYVTTTYVEDRAKIALDLKDMSEALNKGLKDHAKSIYIDGTNSGKYDDDGIFLELRNFRSFSTVSTLEMVDEPTFNIFQYVLQEPDRSFMGRDARLYADTLVNEAFTLTSSTSKTVPVEAALVLNLWMEVAHMLHKMLYLCKNKEIKDTDGVYAVDVVAAYWIGDSQVAGNGDQGHLLYALAERMGELFNMDVGGQSRTNTNIIRLLNQAKNEIMLPNACSENPAAFGRLSQISNKIMSQMAIPLIQGLIHNLRVNDRDRVKIYAYAFVPLVAGFNPSSFRYLRDKLINDLSYNVIEVDEIVYHIRKTYPGLNLQCEDVGVHNSEKTEGAKMCDDPDVFSPIAGYKPSTDVRKVCYRLLLAAIFPKTIWKFSHLALLL